MFESCNRIIDHITNCIHCQNELVLMRSRLQYKNNFHQRIHKIDESRRLELIAISTILEKHIGTYSSRIEILPEGLIPEHLYLAMVEEMLHILTSWKSN